MASLPDHPPEINALLARAEASRSHLGHSVVRVRRSLEIPGRIATSVRSRPLLWAAGGAAAGVGLILVLRALPRRRNGKPRRLRKAALGLVLAAAKPTIKAWLLKQAKSQLESFIAERLRQKTS